jgi:hypothetical protein
MMPCKKTSTGPNTSISGWKMLARTMITLLVDQPARGKRVVGQIWTRQSPSSESHVLDATARRRLHVHCVAGRAICKGGEPPSPGQPSALGSP